MEKISIYKDNRFCLIYKKLQMNKYSNYDQEEKKKY